MTVSINVNRGFERVSEFQWEIDNPKDNDFKIEDVKLPARATRTSAGYDIFATQPIWLFPQDEIQMPLGFKVYMREGEVFQIYPRSKQGFNFYLRLANSVGIIDSDYYDNSKNEGHCWIKLRNEGDEAFSAEVGEAIGQGIFQKFLLADGDTFLGGKLREGGLGSTDKK